MNLIDAIKSGKPYRRKFWDDGNGEWRPAFDNTRLQERWKHAYTETVEDLTADDWEIQERSIAITRTQFFQAWAEELKALGYQYWTAHGQKDIDAKTLMTSNVAISVSRRLGLEEQP